MLLCTHRRHAPTVAMQPAEVPSRLTPLPHTVFDQLFVSECHGRPTALNEETRPYGPGTRLLPLDPCPSHLLFLRFLLVALSMHIPLADPEVAARHRRCAPPAIVPPRTIASRHHHPSPPPVTANHHRFPPPPPATAAIDLVDEHGACAAIPAPPPPPDIFLDNYGVPPTPKELEGMAVRKLCRAFTYTPASETADELRLVSSIRVALSALSDR